MGDRVIGTEETLSDSGPADSLQNNARVEVSMGNPSLGWSANIIEHLVYARDCRASKINAPQSLPFRNSALAAEGNLFVANSPTGLVCCRRGDVPGPPEDSWCRLIFIH